jgi:cytochrome c553
MKKAKGRTALGGALRVALGGAVLVAMGACTTPDEKEDIAKIEHKCAACHGVNGKNDASFFPRLAGQQKDYIAAELKLFQDHSRADPYAHGFMWGMAAGLNDQTIDRLAADYAAQTPLPGVAGDPAAVEAGRKIYMKGIPEQNVPICASCHGDHALGAPAQAGNPTYPRLAGQHRIYLENQMAGFASNARANKIMHQNVLNLSEDQIHQVATYLAAQ